jgi:polysaccharide export outer membrane protein
MRSTIQIALAAFAIMLPLVSCGGPGSGLPPLEPTVADEVNYRLGPGDKLHVQVSVTILAYRPFYIYGEVTKPGGYPYASGMRVLSAVATAGGFTYRANQNYVVITRNGQERKAEPNSPIQPDDVIRVPQRFF